MWRAMNDINSLFIQRISSYRILFVCTISSQPSFEAITGGIHRVYCKEEEVLVSLPQANIGNGPYVPV